MSGLKLVTRLAITEDLWDEFVKLRISDDDERILVTEFF